MKNLFSIFACLAFTLVSQSCQQQESENMVKRFIDSGWTYQQVNGELSGAATMPGTIHTDLLANGQIEDPFYRTNEKELQWVDKEDWQYVTYFIVEPVELKRDRMVLHFYGLDTYADIYVNGQLLLKANNMHREWEVDVKDHVKAGKNELKVYLHSPINRGLSLYDKAAYSYPAINDQSENGGLGHKKVSVFTRKAGYHYGWDWGPRFVTSGIWRPVELQVWDKARIENLFIKQPDVNEQKAQLIALVNIEAEEDFSGEIVVYNMTDSKEMVRQQVRLSNGHNELELPFEIVQPKLWWSNGLGGQHMYDFQVQLVENGKRLAIENETIGLRSIRLVREKDEAGESFEFEINGIRVFAKGANYIPNDIFLPRVSRQDYEKVVADAVHANMNMLRVWGGGVYEDSYFYELCDKNGILVWQDFMFACSMYPGDSAFLTNVRQEAIDNVIRLRNHPSIALWCGNNEINAAWSYSSEGGWGWKERYTHEQKEEIQKAYLDVFHKIIPDVITKYTDGDSYWPSSPQAGYEADQHAGYENKSGDMHYWGVWHGLHPFEDFERYQARFMSEYGFQSFPDFETVKTYALPEDYNIESDVMAAHQRSGIGNLRIREYLSWYYHVPDDFEQFLYMSQVLQAYGIRMAIEAHRRAMPYCMGSLYWQLNDCWPVASWSSTDYYHKWKAVHYAVKRAFQPVMISTANNSDQVDVFVVSDLLKDIESKLHMQVIDFKGNVLYENSTDIVVVQNTSTRLFSFDISQIERLDRAASVLVLSVIEKDRVIATKNHFFDIPKNLQYPEVHIEIMVEQSKDGYDLRLKSDALAGSVYLYDDRSGLVLEDNYFNLLPHKEKVISVLEYNELPDAGHIRAYHLGDSK
jgi:beta-mannosidase